MNLKLTYIFLLITFVCFGTITKVTRVIDGDTFETETGEKVRLIGINAPEISDIFGQDAKQYLSELIENKTVELQIGNLSNDRDRYNRLLRYVFLDGVDINKKMIAEGYAFAYLKYRFSKSSDYEQTQLKASKNNNGIWGNSEKGVINSEQEKKENIFWEEIPLKVYFVGSLVILLLLVGIYTFLRK